MTTEKANLLVFDQILRPPTCECKLSFFICFSVFLCPHLLFGLFFIYKTLKAHFEMRSFSIEMNKMEFNAVYSVCL